jgi:hypothetical protein
MIAIGNLIGLARTVAALAGAVLALASCSGTPAPQSLLPESVVALSSIRYQTAAHGVYVIGRNSSTVDAYRVENSKNKPPICSFSSGNEGEIVTYDLAADRGGNLIVPTKNGAIVFSGPDLCGSELGAISDPWGTPVDAYSTNAASGAVYLASLTDQYYQPNVAVCTLSGGCTKDLTNPYFSNGTGVAVDAKGNVYFSGTSDYKAAVLEFTGGSGSGNVIVKFPFGVPGGIQIDRKGNIVALDPGDQALYVYSGCPASCTAHGPFTLEGESFYGKFNAKGNQLDVADTTTNAVDVYAYDGTNGVTYSYSYSSGMPGRLGGIAVSPLGR